MTTHAERPALTLPVGTRDHAQGPDDADVTLVEYGDYQCPDCRRAHPVVKAVQERFGARLRFVFRNFPLSEAHPNAAGAAAAAEAAGAQGAFWAMHDALFGPPESLAESAILARASQLGLDVERMSAELQSHTHAARVREDFLSGVRSGVNGTPTFFIDGVRHDGNWDEPFLISALEAAIRSRRG